VISQEINDEYKQSTHCNIPANCKESEEVITDVGSMFPLKDVKEFDDLPSASHLKYQDKQEISQTNGNITVNITHWSNHEEA